MYVNVTLTETDPTDPYFTDLERIKLEDILSTILEEYSLAATQFGPFASGHEGVAIIQEEFEELKEAVFWPHKNDSDSTLEAKQVAAMAIRFLMDISYA